MLLKKKFIIMLLLLYWEVQHNFLVESHFLYFFVSFLFNKIRNYHTLFLVRPVNFQLRLAVNFWEFSASFILNLFLDFETSMSILATIFVKLLYSQCSVS